MHNTDPQPKTDRENIKEHPKEKENKKKREKKIRKKKGNPLIQLFRCKTCSNLSYINCSKG